MYCKILCMRRGYHSTLLKTFCLTVPIKFVGEHFSVPEKIFYRKFSSIGFGHHGFVEFFCPTGPKRKVSWRNLSVFRIFLVSKKKLWIRGGLSRFSVEIFTSHIAENFREGILLFGEKFWFQKVLWIKRGLSRFFVGIFRSHSARKFRGHPFNVSEILGIENFFAK